LMSIECRRFRLLMKWLTNYVDHSAVDESQMIAFYFLAYVLKHYLLMRATWNSIVFLYAFYLTVRRDRQCCLLLKPAGFVILTADCVLQDSTI